MTGDLQTVIASDGYPLCVHCDRPASKVRGIVLAIHGIQSHAGWYRRSSAAMAEAGFAVYFADRRGSGQNPPPRGHADHGWRLIHDVRHVLRHARREQLPNLPVALLGVSWGGKSAAATAAAFPDEVDGLALLYPGLEPRIRPGWVARQQLRLARAWDVRHRTVPLPLSDPSLFTDDIAWQQMIRDDPLALHEVTSGFLNAGRDLDALLHRAAHRITHPTLLMLAGRDRIIDNWRTCRRVAEFGTRHLTTIRFPQARHTLEFEPPDCGFVALLVRWLEAWAAGESSVPDGPRSVDRPNGDSGVSVSSTPP